MLIYIGGLHGQFQRIQCRSCISRSNPGQMPLCLFIQLDFHSPESTFRIPDGHLKDILKILGIQ